MLHYSWCIYFEFDIFRINQVGHQIHIWYITCTLSCIRCGNKRIPVSFDSFHWCCMSTYITYRVNLITASCNSNSVNFIFFWSNCSCISWISYCFMVQDFWFWDLFEYIKSFNVGASVYPWNSLPNLFSAPVIQLSLIVLLLCCINSL